MSALPVTIESPVIAPATLLQVIARAAENPAVDIDKMERLMAMYERILARDAEAAFNDALSGAQRDCGPIGQDATNPQTKSKYATYGNLDKALRPIYTRYGFAISYDTDDSPKAEHVRVLAYVAKGAYSRTYKVDMPADGKGAKGGDVMTKTHAAGAALSYGKRYLLKAIFNVAEGEGDNDGNQGMAESAFEAWEKAIRAATTKEKAKEQYMAAIKECRAARDVAAAESLKAVLVEHGKFIDQAGK